MGVKKFSPAEPHTPHRAEQKECRQSRPRLARLSGRFFLGSGFGAARSGSNAAFGFAQVLAIARVVVLVGMPRVLGIGAFWKEALPAMRTTAAQGRTAAFGLHPGTKAMLADARAL